MAELGVPARQDWLPSALAVHFGHEPAISDPWPRLTSAIETLRVATAETQDAAIRGAAEFEGLADALLDDFRSAPLDNSDRQSPMRVVLMGRTMAGKSSLLAALTGSHRDRIGDGRQRFSRDVFLAAVAGQDRIELVDTPGVGAHGGTDDTEEALRAALDADLILWVNSSDSIQEESATALRTLGVVGKPIVVVLNCRQSLEGVGRLNLLRYPERVFGDKEELITEIERHMAKAGVQPLAMSYVHALAAVEAQAVAGGDPVLHAASRIDELMETLVGEHAAHSEGRRTVRLVDGVRQPAEVFASSLTRGAIALEVTAERERSMTNDAHARLARAVRATGEAMASDVETVIGRRRDWHLNVTDFGKSLQSDWQREITAIHEELGKQFEERRIALAKQMSTTIEDVDAEWTAVLSEGFELRDLSGFDAVWGNRLVRAGVGIGGSLLVLGAAAVVGGPVGIAIAILGSPLAGLALTPVKNLADRIFLGKDGVLRKRRKQVAKQIGPILDELTQDYERAIAVNLDGLQSSLATERARSDDRSESMERVASRWRTRNEYLRGLMSELDRETAATLLRLCGRERLARAVKRATRVPGVCILAEVEDSAFSEAWLYPPDLVERLACSRAPNAGFEPAIALTYAHGLADARVSLPKASPELAIIWIDAPIPAAISDTWAAALSAHIGKTIRIETAGRATRT